MLKRTKLVVWMLCFATLLVANNVRSAELLDRVAVIVNQDVILENQIEKAIENLKQQAARNGQELPSDKALRVQVTEKLILNALQQQMAERIGLQVSDAQVQQAAQNIAKEQKMSLAQFRNTLIAQGEDYEAFLDQLKQEITANEVKRAMVSRRVYVSQQEIDGLVTLLKERGQQSEEYHLGHILIGLPSEPKVEDVDAAKLRAEKVLELLQDDSKDFKKVAIGASSGPKALEGGDFGWMNINEMPTLFAEAVTGQNKGSLIGPIRSGAGFHILKIFDIRGRQSVEKFEVNARHILIKPNVILSDAKAKNMLSALLQQVEADEADFAEYARLNSDDPGSAAKGGELGWADPEMYVPAFKNALAELEPGEYSEPFKSVHGWHLVQLLDRRTRDATETAYEDHAYRMLFNRKFNEEAEAWLRELREQGYVEVLGKDN
ncbi:peptidylprolyl isomerase SurA [Gayadomonas joobiniege]|uniref:peptidylprolyl isomerase SurA n=1 Tax=Gayadomonas joobiniege TaxID=1234606 RepID=UPI00036991A0|nr:peptidylprolyl isomerase SurA [Gayadomonas joobiniege]